MILRGGFDCWCGAQLPDRESLQDHQIDGCMVIKEAELAVADVQKLPAPRLNSSETPVAEAENEKKSTSLCEEADSSTDENLRSVMRSYQEHVLEDLETNDLFDDDTNAKDFLDRLVKIMQTMGQQLVLLDEKCTTLQQDNIYLRGENTTLKNKMKVKETNPQGNEENVEQHDDDKSNEDNHECGCCKTTMRCSTRLLNEITQLKTALAGTRLHETTDSDSSSSSQSHANPPPSPVNFCSSTFDVSQGESVDRLMAELEVEDALEDVMMEQLNEVRRMKHQSFLQKNPNWRSKETGDAEPQLYNWECSSSGTARKTLQKMGYKGGGLGKNEDGMREALSVQNDQRKTSIFSSSITRGIRLNGFNKGYKKGAAIIHRFHGGKVHHIRNYLSTHLEEEKPDSVVIVAGGNDLPNGESSSIVIDDIANDIIECRQRSREHGVVDVFI